MPSIILLHSLDALLQTIQTPLGLSVEFIIAHIIAKSSRYYEPRVKGNIMMAGNSKFSIEDYYNTISKKIEHISGFKLVHHKGICES